MPCQCGEPSALIFVGDRIHSLALRACIFSQREPSEQRVGPVPNGRNVVNQATKKTSFVKITLFGGIENE